VQGISFGSQLSPPISNQPQETFSNKQVDQVDGQKQSNDSKYSSSNGKTNEQ